MFFDLRYVIRRLARSPASATLVVLSLGVGMGAASAMLAVEDTLFMRPPAGVRDPSRVVAVGPWTDFQRTTYPDYLDARNQARSFQAVGAFATWQYTVRVGSSVLPAHGMLASGALLPLLGIAPVAGRLFTESEDRPGAEAVVLVSRAFGRRAVGVERPLGATVFLANRPFTVIGVLPTETTAPDLSPVDVVLPITNAPWFGGTEALDSRDYSWLRIVGRLRSGVTLAQASEEATMIYRRANQGARTVDQTALARLVVPVRPIVLARRNANDPSARVMVWITLLAAAVLLIACTNAASVLLARALRERHALAMHTVLGSSRRRTLGRELLEVTLLVAAAAVISLFVARKAGIALTSLLLAESLPPPPLDIRMVLAVGGVALATAALCAIAPTMWVMRLDPRAELAVTSPTTSRSHRRTFRLLLITQGGLCFVLVAAALLFGASLRNATRVDLGVDLNHLLIADADLHAAGLKGADAGAAVRRVLERLTRIPGVVAAGATDAAAMPGLLSYPLTVSDGETDGQTPEPRPPWLNGVTAGYAQALGLRLLAGRALTDLDTQGDRPVMLVSEAFARHFWRRRGAVGRCVRIGDATAGCAEVVGVVANRHAGPGDTREDLEVYVPLGSSLIPPPVAELFPGREVAIRVVGDPTHVVPAVRGALLAAVPELTSVRVRTGDEYLERQFRVWRLGVGVLGAFGVVALGLAVVGVFGASASDVARRARELGIRGALGARPRDLAALVIAESLRVWGASVAIGVVGALVGGRLLRAYAFGVSSADPRIFATVALVFLLTTVLAVALPARRAAGADPAVALRSE